MDLTPTPSHLMKKLLPLQWVEMGSFLPGEKREISQVKALLLKLPLIAVEVIGRKMMDHAKLLQLEIT